MDSKNDQFVGIIAGSAASDKCEIHLIKFPHGQTCPKCMKEKTS
jgi:hypothetical protein